MTRMQPGMQWSPGNSITIRPIVHTEADPDTAYVHLDAQVMRRRRLVCALLTTLLCNIAFVLLYIHVRT
jgi:hypothetical protein